MWALFPLFATSKTGWWMLDSPFSTCKFGGWMWMLFPLFAISKTGWWVLVTPFAIGKAGGWVLFLPFAISELC